MPLSSKGSTTSDHRHRTVLSASSPRLVAGCILTILVVVLWVTGSVLSQYLLDNENWNKPLFMTSFNTGLYMFFLLGFVFFKSWEDEPSPSFLAEDFGPVDSVSHEAAIHLLAPPSKDSSPNAAKPDLARVVRRHRST